MKILSKILGIMKRREIGSVQYDKDGNICVKKRSPYRIPSEIEMKFHRVAGFPYSELYYVTYNDGGGYLAEGVDIYTIIYDIEHRGYYATPF